MGDSLTHKSGERHFRRSPESLSRRAARERRCSASFVKMLFEHFIHPTGIYVVKCRDPVLKLTVPVPNPDIYGVVEG
jgi:hypothetical protein